MTDTTCDGCGKKVTHISSQRNFRVGLVNGDVVTYDMCPECSAAIADVMVKAIEEWRKDKKK